jgi:glycosyltransferase involved in cell wall biosynthesis
LGASGGEPATEEPLPAATGRDVAGVRTVLFVGNLVAVKGADRLLSAFARLRTQARLVIIGDGPCRRRLVALARDLGVAATVRFLGCQSQPEVAEWMRRSDCLCLPSRSEGMPNVVVEALACGTPVVATDVGEVPFLVQDGVNGFVLRASLTEGDRRVEEEVAAGLAAALDQVLERDWDRQAISSRLQGYTWERAAAVVAGAVRTVTPPRPGAEPRQQMPCSEPSTSG